MYGFEQVGRVVSRVAFTRWLSVAALGLLACSGSTEKPEGTLGSAKSALIPLEPGTAVEPGAPSVRSPTCPGGALPDQCGTWAGVELRAARGADKASWHGDAGTADSHCLCRAIDFQIPTTLPVTNGRAGSGWDQARLSFREASGQTVECSYKGNGTASGGGNAYVFERCTRGKMAGQTARSDWFELEVDDGHPEGAAVEVSVRLGAPDVVNGVVQEQIFYSDDPRIAGAALYVPRGSAPPFETFSLDALAQVPPGTALQGGSATSVGYGVDVHSDTTDDFVFTPVAGAACPRIELPYDQAALESLLGPGKEAQLQGNQILTLTNVTGSGNLASAGPVTVNLARRTIIFCVEHLSFWVTTVSSARASISAARLDGPGVNDVNLMTIGTPPLMTPGSSYTLSITFKNEGTGQWTSAFKLYAVSAATYTPPIVPGSTATVTAYNTTGQPAKSPWNETIPALTGTPVTAGNQTTVAVTITPPNTPAPLNFCLADATGALFGLCFSWETKATGGGSAPVATAEFCDGNNVDNDLDGLNDVQEGLTRVFYRDADGDTFGDVNSPTGQLCAAPSGYVADSTDCNDGDGAAHEVATYYPDCDADSYGGNESCFMPQQESVPITEVPVVSGCVAPPQPAVVPLDWQGTTSMLVHYVTTGGDCNNYSQFTHPGAEERCDYTDNNCVDGTNDEVRTVSYRLDLDFDRWCQAESIMGCPNSLLGSYREASQCNAIIDPPTVITSDCNDDNTQAGESCAEYANTVSPAFATAGGLFGNVEFWPFWVDCGPGWHLSSCEAIKVAGNGNVSIDFCPVGRRSTEVHLRFGVAAFQAVSGYGIGYCAPDASYRP